MVYEPGDRHRRMLSPTEWLMGGSLVGSVEIEVQ